MPFPHDVLDYSLLCMSILHISIAGKLQQYLYKTHILPTAILFIFPLFLLFPMKEHWKYDPFAAVKEENGDIYARGTQVSGGVAGIEILFCTFL